MQGSQLQMCCSERANRRAQCSSVCVRTSGVFRTGRCIARATKRGPVPDCGIFETGKRRGQQINDTVSQCGCGERSRASTETWQLCAGGCLCPLISFSAQAGKLRQRRRGLKCNGPLCVCGLKRKQASLILCLQERIAMSADRRCGVPICGARSCQGTGESHLVVCGHKRPPQREQSRIFLSTKNRRYSCNAVSSARIALHVASGSHLRGGPQSSSSQT